MVLQSIFPVVVIVFVVVPVVLIVISKSLNAQMLCVLPVPKEMSAAPEATRLPELLVIDIFGYKVWVTRSKSPDVRIKSP